MLERHTPETNIVTNPLGLAPREQPNSPTSGNIRVVQAYMTEDEQIFLDPVKAQEHIDELARIKTIKQWFADNTDPYMDVDSVQRLMIGQGLVLINGKNNR